MKKPTAKELERVAKRIREDCLAPLKSRFPERFQKHWAATGEADKAIWLEIARWHLDHTEK